MDDDARRQKNVLKQELLSRTEEALFQINKTKKRNSRSASLEHWQQEKKEKDHRKSKLEKGKKFTCQLCSLSYFYKQGLSKQKKEAYHKTREQEQEMKLNNEIIHIIIYRQKRTLMIILINRSLVSSVL